MLAASGTSPNRLLTRSTWVSTAIVGLPKWKFKTTLAVDTHVERVTKRFGIVSESASNQRAHEVLDGLVPDELTYPLHVLLIRHGRTYCTARNPDCENPVCETYCACEGC